MQYITFKIIVVENKNFICQSDDKIRIFCPFGSLWQLWATVSLGVHYFLHNIKGIVQLWFRI